MVTFIVNQRAKVVKDDQKHTCAEKNTKWKLSSNYIQNCPKFIPPKLSLSEHIHSTWVQKII